jgi:chemotaxis protein methyltransferase CheR
LTLTQDDFSYVRELVRRESAIVLDESKAYLIEARLTPVARDAGVENIAGLVHELKRGAPADELRALVIEAMTTNETSFFRDVHPFEALGAEVLPALADARATSRSLRIWSAASSTGQEAYTIAIVVRQRVPQLAGWKVRITGTDLSAAVLSQAREGRYAQLEVNRGLPATVLTKYFEREGVAWRVKPELRELVEFTQMNLITTWPPMGRFDVIFLRNVLIYFDVETKKAILDRVKTVLAPDGYLFLGASEMMTGLSDGYRLEKSGRAMWYRPASMLNNPESGPILKRTPEDRRRIT